MINLIFVILMFTVIIIGFSFPRHKSIIKFDKKNKTYFDKLMEDKEFSKKFDEEYDKLLAITDAQVRKIKSLEGELDDWKYNLAYFTDEDIATPEGVRTFIGKNFLNDAKEEQELDRLHKSIIKIAICGSKEKKFKSVPEFTVAQLYKRTIKTEEELKELEDDYLKLCKEIGIEEPALYRAIEVMLKPKFKKKVKELIKNYKKSSISKSRTILSKFKDSIYKQYKRLI